ncbi:hypothetical protein BG004_002036, partial [Podila humilis]
MLSPPPLSRRSSLATAEGLVLPLPSRLPSPLPAQLKDDNTFPIAPSAVPTTPVTSFPHVDHLVPVIIIPCSIVGVLVRLGLVYIFTFQGQQVFPLIWPQFLGSFLMGLLVSVRTWIEQGSQKQWQQITGPAMYIGLTSGLCGSITTFSSWSLAMFEELINPTKIARHPLQNILSAISELGVTLAMAMSGLQLGGHLGEVLVSAKEPNPTTSSAATRSQVVNSNNQSATPLQTAPAIQSKYWILHFTLVVLSLLVWVAVIVASIWMPTESRDSWRHVVFSCALAPLGAILRWYLSRFSLRIPYFPIGTFGANILGSFILAAVVCLQFSPTITGVQPT